MSFYADLHIHSKYARATSRDCDLEHLYLWAQKKGVSLLGTGDFTHPAWLAEIKNKLIPAEPGIFRLRKDIENDMNQQLDESTRGRMRFMLEVEISTIYKKGDKTRKVHHLIYVPDLESAERLIQKLGRIGNLNADGRPILGLDSRDLLEITLEAGKGSYLVPAHIWTPWFSALGSKSGFDAIEDCYGDLASHIFAVETGLSSDPPMNWRVSSLDRYQLVSNSDAHSPPKIGREASVFDTEMDYFSIRHALETGEGYQGTVEFFPEEGKYHLDGHRKCEVRLTPSETEHYKNLCPVCEKPLTVDVLNRISKLADRPEDTEHAQKKIPFRNLVPLPEVISEIQGVGPKSKRVQKDYEQVISRLGSELYILEKAPFEDLERLGSPLLAEAVKRMRNSDVIRESGYDGEYGVISLFRKKELKQEKSVGMLFDLPRKQSNPAKKKNPPSQTPNPKSMQSIVPKSEVQNPKSLDLEQHTAAQMVAGPLLIIAGPGTGKTRTLTHRIAHLVNDHHVPPKHCLAITFTNRAAAEMSDRLQQLLPNRVSTPVMTLHALGLKILRAHSELIGLETPIQVAAEKERVDLLCQIHSVSERKAKQMLKEFSNLNAPGISQSFTSDAVSSATPDREEASSQNRILYQQEMRSRGLVDFEDLILLPIKLLEAHLDLVVHYRKQYPWISVDEYQDIDRNQYQLIKLLTPAEGNLCAIGDPDQSIYGFRGSDPTIFQQFRTDFPSAQTVELTKNYRSIPSIVDASLQVISSTSLVENRVLESFLEDPHKITIHQSSHDRSEAKYVVDTIEQLMGGSSFYSIDSGQVQTDEEEALAFSDFAILYRTDAQSKILCETLNRSGIPFQKRSHHSLTENVRAQTVLDTILDPSVKRGFLHEPFGPKGITKKPRRTQRVRLRFFATFCLQSIRTEIPRLTDGSRLI